MAGRGRGSLWVLFWLVCSRDALRAAAAASGSIGNSVASGFGMSNITATTTTLSNNQSADSCWSSWTDYWSYSQATASPKTSDVTTVTSTAIGYNSGYAGTTETELLTLTGTPGSSFTTIDTFTSYTRISYNGTVVPKPTCQLPSLVAQCQSRWETYASSQLLPSPTPPSHCDINQGIVTAFTDKTQPACASTYQAALSSWRSGLASITKPPCAQASVSGALCSTIKDAYVHQQNSVFFPNVSFAPYFSNGYLGSFANITAADYTKSWWWPTSSTLGVPGCTLGCGRCAVTGGTVQLIYWPEPTQGADDIEKTAPVTISTLGTVFTSPTYYVSYKSVFASDGCSGVGPTHYNTIVPIPGTEKISSVFGGTLPCVAHVQNTFTQEWTATASFNITDMNEPVPFSIYSSQPWCATYQFEHGCKKSCPTTEAYKPIIVVPEVVLQNMDPAWTSCYGDIRGVYDPPLALQPAGSVKGPEKTGAAPAQSGAATTGCSSSLVEPAAQSATVLVLSNNVPSSSVGIPLPQVTTSSHDGGGSAACSYPSSQGPDSGAHTGSNAWQHVGGIVASILGGVGDTHHTRSESSGHTHHIEPIVGANLGAVPLDPPGAEHTSSPPQIADGGGNVGHSSAPTAQPDAGDASQITAASGEAEHTSRPTSQANIASVSQGTTAGSGETDHTSLPTTICPDRIGLLAEGPSTVPGSDSNTVGISSTQSTAGSANELVSGATTNSARPSVEVASTSLAERSICVMWPPVVLAMSMVLIGLIRAM